ncbi:Fasciclin-domain-containing protein [Phialemonium atrogriseum]|uniref:Fasciclin-domain-containing protein n=1 Tax=Phialemonium atrogriseum TaxID=1093897 RepID=A0AAJ0BUA8_9PEZI|nr:Fasciclin-domain-containing protein [Phialemonium atrogriseum]KAK1764132.1 Fasciclin-domain-containing protein [Phialemonium atrogriseum]
MMRPFCVVSPGVGFPAPLLGLLAIILLCATDAVGAASTRDLGSVLADHKDLSTYYNLVKEYPDILLQLPSYSGVTIIAPNNDAFEKLQDWDPKNKTLVTSILEYHILQGTVATNALPEGPSTFASTLLTNPAYTNVTGGQNVIINKQPGDVVVLTSGGGSRSTLLDADIAFSGGLIQVVDTLLVPPPRLEPTFRDVYPQDLTAFLGALYAAGLVPLFADSANVTVFAPRNAAFQLVSGALSTLDRDALARVLRYHLVPGRILPSSALFAPDGPNSTDTAATNTTTGNATNGAASLRISRAGNSVFVDGARIVQPDVLLANGVAHIVDAVLNPDDVGPPPDPAEPSQAPAFALTGATSTGARAPTPFTSALPCTTAAREVAAALIGGDGNSDGDGGSGDDDGGSGNDND